MIVLEQLYGLSQVSMDYIVMSARMWSPAFTPFSAKGIIITWSRNHHRICYSSYL